MNELKKVPNFMKEFHWDAHNKEKVFAYLDMLAELNKYIHDNNLSYEDKENLCRQIISNKYHDEKKLFSVKPHNNHEFNNYQALRCKLKSIITTKQNKDKYSEHDDSLKFVGEYVVENGITKLGWALTNLDETMYLNSYDYKRDKQNAAYQTKLRNKRGGTKQQ